MGSYDAGKEALVRAARDLTGKGYLMATGGNLSLRIPGENVFLITPSDRDYLTMSPGDICVLDFGLDILEGALKPSVESAMHAGIYRARKDVYAIVHTHQAYASALGVIRASIPALFDEQARFLGRRVRVIPYAPSGTGMLARTVARYVRNGDNAWIMGNHGALCFGHDLARAVHNVEILEKCSLAWLIALCTGKKTRKIPLAVREIAFAKLRADMGKIGSGTVPDASGRA